MYVTLPAICSLLVLQASPLVQAASFPPPTGPYNVGYTQKVFNHTTPNDPVAPKNASDTLLVTIYYPTLSIPTPNATAPYLDSVTAELWGSALQFPSRSLESLKTWNIIDATPLKATDGGGKLPTVLLSPGGGVNSIMYNALSSNLASNGYTVLAIDHPGEIPYLALPPNPVGLNGVYGLDITYVWNQPLQEAVFDYRVSDALALVNGLYLAFVEEEKLSWNTTHYLMLGHSLGGAASAAAVSSAPEKILGGINLDGLFVDLPDVGNPFLMMAGQEHTLDLDATWGPFSQNQTGWWQWVNVTGSNHLDYSDLGDWVDLQGLRNQTLMPQVGPIWAPRMNYLVEEWVKGFFGFVLGETSWEDLVDGAKLKWPEMVFVNGSSKSAR
ncbi:Alpha/Beta hydrolase protein [Clohesyomyces aquaticus]|uniref:1-alkyl-2-acetylglycerophosphocholine esterase n=1 Tax=Clohesyomyces aquaticus TaxID=1231657 RepID=A0A1Y1YR01_9PLEO|nr:Alpha/Beta hydrolase protein [Clohesyomyces aquaticus]